MDALDQEIAAEIAKERKLRSQGESLLAKADASKLKIVVLQRAAALRPAPEASATVGNAGAQRELLPHPVADFVKRATAEPGDDANGVRRGGRQPGAISAQWKEVLSTLYMMGGKYTYAQIHETATKLNMTLDIASTRERIRLFVERGFMAGNPTDGFEVTWDAMEKFGFKRDTAPDGAETVKGPFSGEE
jgi:hypothetical protein